MVKINFIKLEENNVDLFMKNFPGNFFEKNATKLVWKCEEVDFEVQ